MPIGKGPHLGLRDYYIDYNLEEVMFRLNHTSGLQYKKFYGEKEISDTVPDHNRLFNDALLYGEEITREQYEQGKRKS